ncbi:MAG TPA: hypothetical protein VFQ76_02155 [Longimicrobiaceae bacterium]|nr:hypothetical protein [Longimicrobiaceae bacterium]
MKWADHSPAAVVICAILLAATSLAAARTEKVEPPVTAAPPVTISATGGGVRVAAPSPVVRVHLEILSESGEVLFDVVGKGSVLDWSLRDGAGQPVADGTYLCVVTVKTLSGGLSQRAGTVVVRDGRATVRGAEAADLTEQQREQVGPLEEGAALTVLGADEDAPRAVVVAHADGTALTSAGKAARADSTGGVEPYATHGVGTQNRLAKWAETGGAGTLTESAVTEAGGLVGIGTSAPVQALHVIGKGLFQTTGTASLVVMDRTDGKIAAVGAGGLSSTFAYDQSGIFKIESNSRERIAAGTFGVDNGATTRLLIDGAGNVAVTTAGQGLILKASNGTVCTRLTINNTGALNTNTVPCP